MANPIHTPPPPRPAAIAEPALEYESLPETGVRPHVVDAELGLPTRVRWSAVIAGLVISAASQVLLGMLGMAVGLSAIDVDDPNPWRALATGTSIWFAISSLISLFLGGFAAAKIARALRRGTGAIHGLITWATSLTMMLFLFAFAGPRRGGPGALSDPMLGPPLDSDLKRIAVQVAWFALIGVCLSLVAAIAGGAAGASRRLGSRTS